MTRREKVILAVTALTAAGAVLYTSGILSPGTAAPGIEPGSGRSVQSGELARITTRFQETALDEWHTTILRARELEWGANPFARNLDLRSSNPAMAPEAFRYTGFLRIGDALIGIINGQEYVPGMWSEDRAFRVISLSPQEARLAQTDSSEEIRLEMEKDPYHD